jgi:chromate transporter
MLQLAFSFFMIGAISFGGGYAMLPLLRHILIGRWLSTEQFNNLLAISQATPGPFAMNIATYVGFTATPYPYLGALITTLSLALPSFVLCMLVAHFVDKFKESMLLKTLLNTLQPALAALIITTGLGLLKEELTNFVIMPQTQNLSKFFNLFNIGALGIFMLCFAMAIVKKKAIFIIAVGAVLGAARQLI